MRNRWQRKSGIALLLATVIAALAWGLWPRPVAVTAIEARRGNFEVTIEEEGRTRVKDRFVISAPVAGYLRRSELHVGDPVAQKQMVARLEPLRPAVLDPRAKAEAEAGVSAAQAALRGAEQAVAAARAEAQYARNDYERKATLHQGGRVSQEELDRADTQLRQATANLRSSQFAVDVAKFRLQAARTALQYSAAGIGDTDETVEVTSPVSGKVLKLYRESEGPIQAGDNLVEVGDPTALEVEIDVLSEDAVRIQTGTPVRFLRWGGEPALHGTVRTVEPVGFTKISALGVEEQRVMVIADLTSPHEEWQKLGDGYRVEAAFILWRGANVLQVPTSALFRYRDQWALFVIEDGRARRRTVEVGRRNGLMAQILDGLREGESVIAHPDERITDDVRVEAQRVAP